MDKITYIYEMGKQTGIHMKPEDAKLLLEKGLVSQGNSLKTCMELKGLQEAVEFTEELAADNAELSEELLRKIHFLLTYRIDYNSAGQYRKSDLQLEGTSYCPPAAEEIQHYMGHFMNQLHTSKGIFSPVEYAVIVHKRILDISPFAHANDRTAFVVLNFLLQKSGEKRIVIPEEKWEAYKSAVEAARQGAFPDVEPLTKLVKECLIKRNEVGV